jgi:hypothetical protein
MREIAEIELAIQGGTEKIEQLGRDGIFFVYSMTIANASTRIQVNKERWTSLCVKWQLLRHLRARRLTKRYVLGTFV